MAKAKLSRSKRKTQAAKTNSSPATAAHKSATKSTSKVSKPTKIKKADVTTTATNPVVLSSSWQLLLKSLRLLRDHWGYFVGLSLVLAVLNLVLVHNLGDVAGLKQQVASIFGSSHNPTTGLATYALLLSNNATSASGAAGVYQYLLFVIGSLAIIWSLRSFASAQSLQPLKIRHAFYKGMYPLVPFILVLIVLVLELLPLIIGSSVYGTVVAAGIAVGPFEQTLWLVFVVLCLALSLWLLTLSLFAAYIVTLPDMSPLQALKDAKRIVKGRQLSIIRKLLFMAVCLLILSVVIMLPFILFASVLGGTVFFLLGVIVLPVLHSYLYSLYRELLL